MASWLRRGESMKHRQHRTNKRDPVLHERARSLRQRMTPAEEILWKELRGRRFAGFKFRRQYTYGPFIVDFYCVDAALAVELDGETHVGRETRDQQRAVWLEGRGLKVLRFYNHDLYDDKEVVLETIYRACERRRGVGTSRLTPSPPTPLPQRGEGRPIVPKAHGLKHAEARTQAPLRQGERPSFSPLPFGGEGSGVRG